jgi:hypothetical protein
MTEVSTSSINHDGVNIGLIGKLFENVKSGHIRRRIVWGMVNGLGTGDGDRRSWNLHGSMVNGHGCLHM